MPLSVFQDPQGVDWPLGFVAVANNGSPVSIMVNVDSGNNNAPNVPTGPGFNVGNAGEYTPTAHKIVLQGFKPGNNNNGMVFNTGNIYILRSLGPAPGNNNSGGPQNRTDSGAMVGIVPPGGSYTLPSDEMEGPKISPYRYMIDSDVNGEGALVTMYGCAKG